MTKLRWAALAVSLIVLALLVPAVIESGIFLVIAVPVLLCCAALIFTRPKQ